MTQQKAVAKKQDVVSMVMGKVTKLQKNNQLVLPPNYSPQNALMSAWLELQHITTKNNQPVLQVCSQASIANALYEMVIFGLNPAKKQCYFIAYGKQLIMQPSRYGYETMARRADPRIDKIVAEVVYEGDEFEYEIKFGEKYITKHKQKLANKNNQPEGAYCVLLDGKGNVLKTEIMTYEQIKKSWQKSPMRPVLENGELKKGSTHAEFLEEMIKKTVIRRACKQIIQSSDDSDLFVETVNNQTVEVEEAKVEEIVEAETATVDFDEEVEKQANGEQPKQEGKKGSSPQEEDLGEDPGF